MVPGKSRNAEAEKNSFFCSFEPSDMHRSCPAITFFWRTFLYRLTPLRPAMLPWRLFAVGVVLLLTFMCLYIYVF